MIKGRKCKIIQFSLCVFRNVENFVWLYFTNKHHIYIKIRTLKMLSVLKTEPDGPGGSLWMQEITNFHYYNHPDKQRFLS